MITILAYTGYFVLLLNLILFSTQFFKETKAYKIFTIYLALSCIIQVWAEILILQKSSNLFLSHFYFIGQFILLSGFYKQILKQDGMQNKIVTACFVVVLLILGVQFASDNTLFFRFNLLEIVITSIVLVVLASFHFYNLLNEKKEFYYVNIGILVYLLGSTILFLVGNLMTSLSAAFNKIPWVLNSFMYLLYQIIILIDWKRRFSNSEIKNEL